MDIEEQEKIFSEIYCECDNNHSNHVQVSLLLSYIKPYIDSTRHFEDVTKSLDPNDVNPSVDKSFFLNAMKKWTEKFKNEVDFNFNSDETSRQSTSTMNVIVDSDPLNLSNISAYSLTGSALSTSDVNIIRDQNNELQHQNKKLTENLDDVKSQLINLEEQNVCLQNDIDRINKNAQNDIKLMKTLQTQCEEYEKEREELTKIINENKKRTEDLLQGKNIKNDLIKELEKQNQSQIESIEKITTEAEILKKENLEHCSEIARIQECEDEWRQRCAQYESNERKYVTEITEFKNHIETLEALLEDAKAEIRNFHNPVKMEHFEPGISSTPVQNVQLETSPENVSCQSASPTDGDSNIITPSSCQNLQAELLQSSSGCFNTRQYRLIQLEEEVAELFDQLTEKTQELEHTKKTNTSIEQELCVARNEILSMIDKQNLLTIDSTQLKNNFAQLETENKQINSKLSYYKSVNKNLKIQLNAKHSNIIELRKKLAHIATIQENLNQIKDELTLKIRENQELTDIILEFKNRFKVMEEEMAELKQLNLKLINEISSLERGAKVERKRNIRIDLNTKINNLEEQLEEFKSKNQKLISTISSITSEKQQLISKLELLENNDHGKRKVENLEMKLQKCRKQVVDLDNMILCKNKEYSDLDAASEKNYADYIALYTYILNVKTLINSNKDSLKITTCYTSDVWKEVLQNVLPDFNISNLLNAPFDVDDVDDIDDVKHQDGPLQDEINLLNNQIRVTVILLQAFASIKNKMTIIDDEKTKIPNCGDSRKLSNPNESFDNESFLSKLTPPLLLIKDKSKDHFVFPPLSAEPEMTPKTIEQPLKLNNNEATMSQETEPSDNSAFIKTYNDSYIEKILMEQKVDEPLAKFEETIQNNKLDENSGSESVSSKGDDDEDVEKKMERRKLRRERKITEDEEIIKESLKRQIRSMAEGATVAHQLSKDGNVMVFPNLQDNSLDALGLVASDQPKERLTDEEIELKFQTLSLAFNIDAITIKARLERQQRQRDLAEDNLSAEISRFVNAVHKLHPLCVDAETTELVTGLIDRLQLIVQASHSISTSAEIFGSVQQEWRIAESVNLMLSHLRNLIKQRDAARRQLQVTKRMLQETTTSCLTKPVTSGTTRRLTINTIPTSVNGRVGVTPPRRASIAVIPRPLESPSAMGAHIRRVAVRKPSEGSSESFFWDSRRAPLLSRPSRIDSINPELSLIREGSADSIDPAESSDENLDFQTPTILLDNPLIAESQAFMHQQHNTIKNILKYYLRYYGQIALRVFETWAEDGTLHEICFIGAIVCFSMATILLCNTIMEIELAREGITPIPWKYVTWDEFWALFFQ